VEYRVDLGYRVGCIWYRVALSIGVTSCGCRVGSARGNGSRICFEINSQSGWLWLALRCRVGYIYYRVGYIQSRVG
jgi:hypothetical protein